MLPESICLVYFVYALYNTTMCAYWFFDEYEEESDDIYTVYSHLSESEYIDWWEKMESMDDDWINLSD